MIRKYIRRFLYILCMLAMGISASGCFKNVYVGDEKEEQEKVNEELPDLSVPATFDWNEVYVRIPVAEGVDAEDIRVSFPPLKYNKRFVYSYTFDDCTIAAYSRGFSLVNKKWMDAEFFFHVGQAKTGGYLSAKTLGYTDGCGNEHRFAFGLAIWPDISNGYIDNLMNPTGKEIGKYYPYAVWKDVVPLIDFGGDIYFHDVKTSDEDTVEAILEGMKSSQEITRKMLGRKMKILARANGNDRYCEAGRLYEDIVFMTAGGYTAGSFPLYVTFDADIDLKNQVQFRRYVESTPDVAQLWPLIESAASSDRYMWVHDFSHGPKEFQYVLDLLTKINDECGKDGADNVWFATLDEVYEYDYLRKNCLIEKEVADNMLTLRFSCSLSGLPDEFMFHRDFSVMLEGDGLLFDANVSSGNNVYGLSYGKGKDNVWLMNIDCNRSLLDKAERYVAAYEKSRDSSDKEDASYFVNLLKKELNTDYRDRINR